MNNAFGEYMSKNCRWERKKMGGSHFDFERAKGWRKHFLS